VLYVDANQHVQTLWYDLAQWHSADLTATFGGPNATAGTPIVTPITGDGDYFYLDVGGNVRELTVLPDGTWTSWSNSNTTALANGTAAMPGSKMTAYLNASNWRYLLYVDVHQHIQVLWNDRTRWNSEDLTAATNGPKAGFGTPIVMAGPGDFYYLDAGGNVRELSVSPDGTWASWTNANITSQAGAPGAPVGSELTAYRNSVGLTYVLYVNANRHIEALWYNGSQWVSADVTSTTSAPNPAPATPIVMSDPGNFYYLDISGNVRQISILANGSWWTMNVTASAGTLTGLPGSHMSAYKAGAQSQTYVLHLNTKEDVEILRYSGSWSGLDVAP
jgi:hypothetical protein